MPTGKPIQYDWGWWDLPEWDLVKWSRQHDEENLACCTLMGLHSFLGGYVL